MKSARWSLAAFGVLALASPAMAQPATAQPAGPATAPQPPPSSPYADGTGNSAVGTLNSGQLDQSYTGPWHQVPPNRPVGGPIRAKALPDAEPTMAAPPSSAYPSCLTYRGIARGCVG